MRCAARTWPFLLRWKGRSFGAGKSWAVAPSAGCEAGRAPHAAALELRSCTCRENKGQKGTWMKCEMRHGCGSTSRRLFRVCRGCFRVLQHPRAQGRVETHRAGGTSQGYRWAHGDTLLCRDFAAWRWRSGWCLESVLNPQTCPSSLSQPSPLCCPKWL